MRCEREPLVGQLEGKFNSLGIRGLLFDLDDTLFETTVYMRKHKWLFCVWAAEKLGVVVERVMEVFEEAAFDALDVLHVAPARWDLAVRMTAERLTGEPYCLDEGIEVLKRLFFESPEVIAGVRPVLELFSQTGVKMGVVTHAPNTPPWNEWTWIKLQRNGLERYFPHIWIADESKPKDEEAWRAGAAMIDVPCENILGIGDNIGADILPMRVLGMRAMAVKAIFRRSNGDLPPGVPLLDSLAQAPEAILAL